MNAKELAAQLDGIEYSATMHMSDSDLMKEAKGAGLVVAYGYSDDLLEFDGAISDEAGAPGTVLLDACGLLPTFESAREDEGEIVRYVERKKAARSIEAVWSYERSSFAWILKTDIPHETFSIMEDGECFSRGIVFALADLVPAEAPIGAELLAETWQQRLIAERDDLDARLVKLGNYIASPDFWRIPAADSALLMEQHNAMTAYANVLERRVARIGGAE